MLRAAAFVGLLLSIAIAQTAIFQSSPIVLRSVSTPGIPDSERNGQVSLPLGAQLRNAADNVRVFPATGVATTIPVCLTAPGAVSCAAGCDTTLATGSLNVDNAGVITLNVNSVSNTAFNQRRLELEALPRLLCTTDVRTVGGLSVAAQTLVAPFFVSFGCVAESETPAAQRCSALAETVLDPNGPYAAVDLAIRRQIAARTQCCRQASSASSVGVCINPNVQTCCGNVPLEPTQLKCCNNVTGVVVGRNDACPCNREIQNPADACPASEPLCCLPTRFPELNTIATVLGECYNPNTHGCCDTGLRFDAGTQQCCAINGLQSVELPCPCGVDNDCVSPSNPTETSRFFRCCQQIYPAPLEEADRCNIYQNFPSGTGIAQIQQCLGVCVDTRFQSCCNGVACIKEFEKCCNNTCCNKFIGDCAEANRPGAFNNRFNYVNFADEPDYVRFWQCTIVEHMSIIGAFWIFGLPAILIITSVIALAIALVAVSRAPGRPYDPVSRAVVVVAFLVWLLAIPFFFAPVYKYGLLFVVAAALAIMAAVRGDGRGFSLFVLIVILFALLYLFDPFFGNAFLTLASTRTTDGDPNPEDAGLYHAVTHMWRNITAVETERYCVDYYDYFALDPQLRDTQRLDNPFVTTFGYCSRNWTFALLVIACPLTFFLLLLFILVALSRYVQNRQYDFAREAQLIAASEAFYQADAVKYAA